MDKKTICVFCGSSLGSDPAYAAAARETGRLIAAEGWSLVFGGGGLGLMGETARAARDGGAGVTGILPQFLRHLEPPLSRGETVEITADLYDRKARMIEEADAFIILSGGLGTLDEFYEVVTSAQLAVHAKPIVLVNTNGYYDPLIALMEHVIAHGFAQPASRKLFQTVATPAEAIDKIKQARGS